MRTGANNLSRTRLPGGRAGITLRETAVLIALLLVAAGLFWPWWNARQRRAIAARGVQNLQQWGIALNLYLIENDNRFPAIGRAAMAEEEPAAWYNALPPYLCAPALRELSPQNRPRPGTPSLWVDALDRGEGAEPPGKGPYFGYGMNRWLQPDPDGEPLFIHDLADPGTTVFLSEVSGYDPGALPGQIRFRRGKKYPSPQAQALVLHCDGHAAPASKEDLVDPFLSPDPPAGTPVTWLPGPGAEPPVRPSGE